MGYKSNKRLKPPTYLTEIGFVSVNLMLLKLYSIETYTATSYFSVLFPLMTYTVLTLFGYLLKFVQMMYIDDEDDSNKILTKK